MRLSSEMGPEMSCSQAFLRWSPSLAHPICTPRRRSSFPARVSSAVAHVHGTCSRPRSLAERARVAGYICPARWPLLDGAATTTPQPSLDPMSPAPSDGPSEAPSATSTAPPSPSAARVLQVTVNGRSVEIQPWDGRHVAFHCLKRRRSPGALRFLYYVLPHACPKCNLFGFAPNTNTRACMHRRARTRQHVHARTRTRACTHEHTYALQP